MDLFTSQEIARSVLEYQQIQRQLADHSEIESGPQGRQVRKEAEGSDRRPTVSRVLYEQIVGRGRRVWYGARRVPA